MAGTTHETIRHSKNGGVICGGTRPMRKKLSGNALRNRQFQGMKFFRQYSVGPSILDFYCPALRLAVELDGRQHNEEMDWEYDNVRSGYLQSQGIKVIRFWNHEVLQQTEAVLLNIAEQIKNLR